MDVKPSTRRFTAYAQSTDLEEVCSSTSLLALANHGIDQLDALSAFYVIEGGKRNLLRRESAVELGVLRIGMPSHVIENVGMTPNDGAKFPSIRRLKIYIEMNPTVTPITQHELS